MDFTSKGKSWAGSIYHQFESICVDEFMTKDTVQYVENRVQSVGESMKRLYSSVKDMIPPSEQDRDQVKSEAQQLHRDENEIEDQINAKNPTSLDEDTLENSLASLTFDENKSQLIEPGSCQDAKTYFVREDHHNHTTKNDRVDLTTSTSFDAKKDRISFVTFSDHTDCFSDASTSGWSFEDNLSSFEDLKTNEDKIPSSPPVSGSVVYSQSSSEFNLTDKGLKEGTIIGYNILTSYSNISESLSESTQSSGVVKRDDRACNSFGSSSATLYRETKAVDLLPVELSNITHITDIDGEMETIDLSTDAKPDRTTIVSDNNLGRSSLSYRRKNFRYYKGLMKNAIASRKSLSKEYEHLAIMYGDIDHDFEPHSLPSSSLPLEMLDNEWELL